MNYKTTLVLVIVLAVAGFALLVPHGDKKDKSTDDTALTGTNPALGLKGDKVIDVAMADVNTVTVTPADGAAFTIDRTTAGGWQLTRPVVAPADTFEVETLLRDLTDARSRGTIDVGTDPKATGLAAPRYKVEVKTAAGKAMALDVGERAVVGGNLYVHAGGKEKADLVGAELADQLDKGADPYRNKQLVTTAADQIRHIAIVRPNTPRVELTKSGTAWQITAPTAVAADDAAATDLAYAVAGLRADSFVDPKQVPATALSRPQVTVEFSTDAPTTAPSAGPATAPVETPATTVVLGSYDDILKKNVYASVKGSNVVAKLPASVLDSLRKSPLDLRDKAVMTVDPAAVAKVSIQIDTPATTQPAAAAATKTVVLERRKPAATVMGPVPMPVTSRPTTQPASMPTLPTVRPTTGPSSMPTLPMTTQPAATQPLGKPVTMPTAPMVPTSAWAVASDGSTDADDAKVTTLLGQFHPLKADKFLEKGPTTALVKRRFTITLTPTTGPATVLTIAEPGNDAPLVAAYNGLTFNLPASLASDLSGDFKKSALPAMPTLPPGLPPGLTIPGR